MTTERYAEIDAALAGITMTAMYHPKDLSKLEDARGRVSMSDLSKEQLDYTIELSLGVRSIIKTEYHMGIGHVPGFSSMKFTTDVWRDLKETFKDGKVSKTRNLFGRTNAVPILPELRDVMCCLLMDASVLDYSSFEDWANEYGYDTDSRKAETTYRQCIETALKLRNALGDLRLEQLRNAYRDY